MNTSLSKITSLVALLCTVFMACKKDHPAPADTGCRLATISKTFDSNQSAINFQYNADGTIMALNSSGFEKESSAFTWYGKNNVLIKRFYAPANQASGLDSLTLNGAGHIINTRLMTSYRTDWTNWSYTLNGANEVQSVLITTSGGKIIPPDAYVYTDGNLVQLGSTKYTYDSTKPAMLGDYHSTALLVNYGLTYMTSKNMVTGVINTPDTTSLQYKYDSRGRIIEMDYVSKGAIRGHYNYTYSCN